MTDFEAELDPIATLAAFVDRHPDDVTARLLLAYLQSLGDSDEDLERALGTLDPLAGSRPIRRSPGWRGVTPYSPTPRPD